MLAGGGSLLQGLDERLREETQMPAHLAESPLTCVAVGSGRSLEEFEVIHRTNKNSKGNRAGAGTDARRARHPIRLWSTSPRVRQDGPPAAGSPRAARRLLPDPPDRLLRRVRPAALHAVQRGVLEVVSPIQEGASRALKPFRDLVGWVGDTLRRQGRGQGPAQPSATRCGAAPSPATAARRENAQLQRHARAWTRRAGAEPRRPGHRARDRAGPDASGTGR